MTKPLKTVEEILDTCIIDGVIPENHAYAVNKAKQELNNHYKELFERVIGEDELYYRPYLVATTKITTSQNQTQARMVLRNRNNLRAELRQKLSEHFNVEGEQ